MLPAFITDANGVKWAIGDAAPGIVVDPAKLLAWLNEGLALFGFNPMAQGDAWREFHAQLSAALGPQPRAVNLLKLLQIGMLVFAWWTSGMNPAGIPALVQQIVAIITGP